MNSDVFLVGYLIEKPVKKTEHISNSDVFLGA